MAVDDASYADLDADAQVAALRPVAEAGARGLHLDVAETHLALHAYNTTFRVETTGGSTYAVRVLTNSRSTLAQLEAQHAWMRAIARETDVLVPDPVTAPDGATYAVVPSEALGRDVVVVAAAWLPGADVGTLSVERAHELGVAMAMLHQQAIAWDPPERADLPTYDDPLFGDDDVLADLDLSDGDRAVIDESFRRTRRAFAEAAALPSMPIHADLHGGNLKWHDGRLAVFDFDDMGIGTSALDLAISTFYLRDGDTATECGLREGYLAIAELPDVAPEVHEGLVASRQLLLANDLLTSSTASLRAEAVDYLRVSLDRLRHWLETGTFTRALP